MAETVVGVLRGTSGRDDVPTGHSLYQRNHRQRQHSSKSTNDTLDRDGVLAALGYKPDKSWKTPVVLLDKSELCIRCGKKVYPVEKIDVGGLYHRSCFKCRACNVHLNLRTFHRDVDPIQSKKTKEIYCKAHVPRGISGQVDSESLEIRRALAAQKQASAQMRRTGYDHEAHYTPDALEFQHHPKAVKRRKKVRRRSTLSHTEFEKYGVYDAQSALEEVHKQEEDELYKQMFQDRKRQIDKLERHLVEEKRRTVKELVAWFNKRDASDEEKQLGIKKIENFYRNQREDRVQLLLRRLTMEEQAAVARMIEKHSQEMLVLIQEKELEAERAMKFEFRESQLLEDGRMMFHSDVEDEDEESGESGDEVEEVTESFSEASYQVEQLEKEEKINDVMLIEQANKLHQGQLWDNELSDVTQSCDRGTTSRHFPQGCERQDSKKDFGRQNEIEPRDPHSASGLPYPGETNMNGNVSNYSYAKTDNRYQPDMKDTRHYRKNHGNRHNKRHIQNQNDIRRPAEPRPLENSVHGLSLSQQLLHVNPPFEDLHFGTDDEGAILVKVHAAQDAHLIDQNLRSHHYCTSPSSNKNRFFDLTNSPKPHRPRSKTPGESGFRSKDSSRQGQKGFGSTTGEKDSSKFMLFQKPEDLQGVRWSDDDYSGEEGVGRATSSSDRHGRDKHRKGKRDTSKETKGDNTRSRSISRHKSHNGSHRSIDELVDKNQEKNMKNLVKNHADLAREALRQMSLGIGDSSGLGSDEVFMEMSPIAPKVAPPKTKKITLYTNPAIFKEFDDNAIQETKREHKTFTELVRKLSRHCESELQRVRSIFRWITAKDLNKLHFSENLDSDSPMGLLRGIKLGVETYHNLCKRLCSYAGLHCEIIEGYSKGAGYKPGGRFQGNHFRNQWTAICIDGAWRFVNCNWGARHVKGPRDDHMTYKCDEFYFLTDPEEHIYQHYPDDPHWQLLSNPITLDKFVKLPVLKSPFFNKQLVLSSEYESSLRTSDGNLETRIISPRSVSFTAQLKSKDGQVKHEVLQDRVLIRRVKDVVIFLTNLPSPGNYFLEIYCDDKEEADSMDNACAFHVRCYGVSQNVHISFPPVGCFGRTSYFRKFDIREETHTDPYVCHNGELLIAFLCKPDLKLSHSMMLWNYRDRKLEEHDRYAFVLHRSDNMISYIIHCPRRGGYVFSLLASNTDSTEAKCICRYYIECRSPGDNSFPLPKASKRWQHCRLIEPLKGNLPMKTRIRFRLESSTAIELVVSIGGAWHGLQRSGYIWQGYVNTGEDKGKLSVYGRFDKGKDKYIPLLEYRVSGSRGVEEEVKSLMKYL